MKYNKEKRPEKSLTRYSYVWNMTETLRADWQFGGNTNMYFLHESSISLTVQFQLTVDDPRSY